MYCTDTNWWVGSYDMWFVEMFDSRTLSLISVVVRINLILLFAVVTFSHKREYMKDFTIGLTISAVGFLLLSLRDYVGLFVTIIISNILIVAGPIYFALGIEKLVGRESKRKYFVMLLVAHTVLFVYFTYFNSNIMLRIVLISYELSIIYLYMAFLFIKSNIEKPNVVRLFVGIVYAANALFFLIRILYTAFDLPKGDLFSGVQYLSLTLLITFVFLVSRSIGVLICVMIEYDEKLMNANRILAELSTTDHLTKVKNHRSLMSGMDREVERVRRYGRSFSIAMVDIDHFKVVNDTYGHTIGDEVLIGVASIFKKELRVIDTIGRYGGEEFLLILPESNCIEAALLLERIKERVKENEWCVPKLTVTFSAGVLEVNSENSDSSIKEIIRKVDELMYVAKRNGRDRVEHLCSYDS